MAAPEPYRLSPVHQLLDGSGAKWKTLRGWKVAACIGTPMAERQAMAETCALADVSFLEKVELRGADLDPSLSDLGFLGGLPPGRVGIAAGNVGLRFTQEQLLVCSSSAMELPLPTTGCVHATERTSGLACFVLCGPKSIEVLNRLTSLDLRTSHFPNLSCARAPLARVNASIARNDAAGAASYWLLVGREYAEYIWRVLTHTGERFGIAAVGVDAVLSLEH